MPRFRRIGERDRLIGRIRGMASEKAQRLRRHRASMKFHYRHRGRNRSPRRDSRQKKKKPPKSHNFCDEGIVPRVTAEAIPGRTGRPKKSFHACFHEARREPIHKSRLGLDSGTGGDQHRLRVRGGRAAKPPTIRRSAKSKPQSISRPTLRTRGEEAGGDLFDPPRNIARVVACEKTKKNLGRCLINCGRARAHSGPACRPMAGQDAREVVGRPPAA